MRYVIDEVTLEYDPSDYEAWASGVKEKWLAGEPPGHVLNQPRYHFGEYFVLSHYSSSGWQGHRFYALGEWEPKSSKLSAGRAALSNSFDTAQLQAFRSQRVLSGRADGKGEPDLFLRKQDGSALFLEVKKDRDEVTEEQLQCLAQIRAVLNAQVGVVRIIPIGAKSHSRRYELDLVAHTGQRVDA